MPLVEKELKYWKFERNLLFYILSLNQSETSRTEELSRELVEANSSLNFLNFK